MSLYKIPCIIFAGGKSSRMGKNKALLPFGSHASLIDYQVQRLKKVFEHVYISAKDKDTFSDIDAPVIQDHLYPDISAPTTGIINIFNQLHSDNSFFILSVDAPFVDEHLISRLINTADMKYEAVITKTASGIHPLCGIYTRALQNPLEQMIKKEVYKLKDLLKNANVCYVEEENEVLLANLNTPAQYQEALKVLS